MASRGPMTGVTMVVDAVLSGTKPCPKAWECRIPIQGGRLGRKRQSSVGAGTPDRAEGCQGREPHKLATAGEPVFRCRSPIAPSAKRARSRGSGRGVGVSQRDTGGERVSPHPTSHPFARFTRDADGRHKIRRFRPNRKGGRAAFANLRPLSRTRPTRRLLPA